MRKGINDLGTDHLLHGLSRSNNFASLFMYALTIINECGVPFRVLRNEGLRIPNWSDLITGFLTTGVLMSLMNYWAYHPTADSARKEGSRLSLIYGPAFDRALILKTLSAKKNIVKALD